MKLTYWVLLGTLLISSCRVSAPHTVEKPITLREGAIQLEPQWKYKDANAIPISTVVGTAAGLAAVLWGDASIDDIEDSVLTAYIVTGVGAIAGLAVGYYIVKEKKVKYRDVRPGQKGRWLKKFNKQQETEYVFYKETPQGEFILITQSLETSLNRLDDRYSAAIKALNKQGSFSYADLQGYRQLMQHQYSDFFVAEDRELTALIEAKEGAAAYVELEQRASEVMRLPTTYRSLNEFTSFPSQNSALIRKVSRSGWQTIQSRLEEGFQTMLADLVREETRKLQAFTYDLTAVPKSKSWATEFKRNYLDKYDEEPVSKGWKFFQAFYAKLLADHREQIQAKYEAENDLGEVRALTTYYQGPSENETIERFLARHEENRINAIKRANVRANPSVYNWYYNMENSEATPLAKVIESITEVDIRVNLEEYLSGESSQDILIKQIIRYLGDRGVRYNPDAEVTLYVEGVFEPYTFTRTRGEEVVKETSFVELRLTAQLWTYGVVYRHPAMYFTRIYLGSATLINLFEDGDFDAYGWRNGVRGMLSEVLAGYRMGNFAATPDNLWQQDFEERYDQAPALYRAYNTATEGFKGVHNLRGLTQVSEIIGRQNSSNKINGFDQVNSYIDNNPLAQFADWLTGGTISENQWKPESRWGTALRSAGVPVSYQGGYFSRPVVTQEISGFDLNLDSQSGAEISSVLSHSFLLEQNCVMLIEDSFYRTAAATLDFHDASVFTEGTFQELRKVTERSGEYFKYHIEESK
ncbi:MAG TPA: hypothetical protein DCE41_18265 [Cytophagales bacterium]|nr:hypothetical protein [Cytophagales bacterium]